MNQKSFDTSINDSKKLMTRNEIIDYLKSKITNYNENKEVLSSSGYYSGSLASVHDFEWIAFDSHF